MAGSEKWGRLKLVSLYSTYYCIVSGGGFPPGTQFLLQRGQIQARRLKGKAGCLSTLRGGLNVDDRKGGDQEDQETELR
jgi:hypothetical protein